MVRSKKPNLEKKWIKISLGVIIVLVVWFYPFQDSERGYDSDEEKHILEFLKDYGYEVNSVKLEGTTIYVDMNSSVLKGSVDWDIQISRGFPTSFYEVEPDTYEILYLPRKELESLGIDYEEIEYMSDDELEEVSEIIGNRASIYVLKMNTPSQVCSYRLSRTTHMAWVKASDIDILGDVATQLYLKMQNEIKNSETCY